MATQVSAVVRQQSESASEGVARGHRVCCDRPEPKGGSNSGPMGGELLLMGLGGCFMSNLLAAIQARHSPVSGVEVAIDADLDGTPPRFTEISLRVSGNYPDRDEMEKLIVIAERGCIVANTLKSAVRLNIALA